MKYLYTRILRRAKCGNPIVLFPVPCGALLLFLGIRIVSTYAHSLGRDFPLPCFLVFYATPCFAKHCAMHCLAHPVN